MGAIATAPLPFMRRFFLLFVGVLAFGSRAIADHPTDSFDGEVGTVHFAVRGRPEARDLVVRGVKLVHHMMYYEADHAFAAASKADPHCALAYWGRAMVLIHPLWPDTPTSDDLRAGAAFIQRGLDCPPATPRERAYLEVLDRYFHREHPEDHPAGLVELDRAWEELAAAYPDDLDALAFSALYHLAPARFVPKEKAYRAQLEAASRAEKVLAQIPDHPGAQHYKIHAFDSPLLADRAIQVCDTYTGIAPDVPHALHMPTHIFTRRGLWDKSIEFNLRSAAAAQKLGEADGALNGHYPHALDYLVYAYLQRGQYRHADDVRRKILELPGPFAATHRPQMAFAFAAIPARCALERHAWREAAALRLHQPAGFAWGNAFVHADAVVHFARGLGAARSGQPDLARRELAELERIEHELTDAKRPAYWISQAETQRLAVRAWIEFDPSHPEPALALMRRAVELEATTNKEAVTPGEVLPAGELLGDMLLDANRAAEALAAFEATLASSPNRLNALHGAGLAAERTGDMAKARRYYEQLINVAAARDSTIPAVEHAEAYLKQNGTPRFK